MVWKFLSKIKSFKQKENDVCALKSIKTTNIIITLGNTIPENKGLGVHKR